MSEQQSKERLKQLAGAYNAQERDNIRFLKREVEQPLVKQSCVGSNASCRVGSNAISGNGVFRRRETPFSELEAA